MKLLKNILNITDKLIKPLYYLVVFLSLFPSFYILSAFGNNTSSQIIALGLSSFILVYCMLRNRSDLSKYSTYLKMLLLFFLVQSISSLVVINTESFLIHYKNLAAGMIIAINTLLVLGNKKNFEKINKVLFLVLFGSICFSVVFYFKLINISFFGNIFHQKYISLLSAHLENNKLLFESFLVCMTPLLFKVIVDSKTTIKKVIFGLLILLISFLSYLSNFRVIFILFILSLLLSFIIIKITHKFYRSWRILLMLSMVIILGILIANNISSTVLNYALIDRFSLSEDSNNASINQRMIYTKEAISIGLAYPIIGVGLGNYYDYLSITKNDFPGKSSLQRSLTVASLEDPHNIFAKLFAETGFIGLISFIVLLIYFIKKDVSAIKIRDPLQLSYIAIFWSHFIYSLFNPSFSFSYLNFFWIMRSLLMIGSVR